MREGEKEIDKERDLERESEREKEREKQRERQRSSSKREQSTNVVKSSEYWYTTTWGHITGCDYSWNQSVKMTDFQYVRDILRQFVIIPPNI